MLPENEKKIRIWRVKLTVNTKPFYIMEGRRFWTLRFGKLSNDPQLVPRIQVLSTVIFFLPCYNQIFIPCSFWSYQIGPKRLHDPSFLPVHSDPGQRGDRPEGQARVPRLQVGDPPWVVFKLGL